MQFFKPISTVFFADPSTGCGAGENAGIQILTPKDCNIQLKNGTYLIRLSV